MCVLDGDAKVVDGDVQVAADVLAKANVLAVMYVTAGVLPAAAATRGAAATADGIGGCAAVARGGPPAADSLTLTVHHRGGMTLGVGAAPGGDGSATGRRRRPRSAAPRPRRRRRRRQATAMRPPPQRMRWPRTPSWRLQDFAARAVAVAVAGGGCSFWAGWGGPPSTAPPVTARCGGHSGG